MSDLSPKTGTEFVTTYHDDKEYTSNCRVHFPARKWNIVNIEEVLIASLCACSNMAPDEPIFPDREPRGLC